MCQNEWFPTHQYARQTLAQVDVLCRKTSVELVCSAKRDPPMLPAMAHANEPEVVAARPDTQAEPGKFNVPDAVFGLAKRQLAPSEVAIEQRPKPALLSRGDQMAIAHTKIAVKSR